MCVSCMGNYWVDRRQNLTLVSQCRALGIGVKDARKKLVKELSIFRIFQIL